MSIPARWCLRLSRRSLHLAKPGKPSIYVTSALPQQTRHLRTRPSRAQPPRQESHNESVPNIGGREEAVRQESESQNGRNTELAKVLSESDSTDLVTPVRIPDDPEGILPANHPALSILGNSSLVIQRQLEMMNVMLGYEQANRYIIMDGQGQTLGYIAEQDHGLGSAVARQMFRTHRSFTTHIFDASQREILRIHRPFAYINSRIRIYDPVPEGGYPEQQGFGPEAVTADGVPTQTSPLKLEEMRIIGEAQQQWAPLRRKYNLFSYRALEASSDSNVPRIESGDQPTSDTKALTEHSTPERAIEAGMAQFANVDEPFLSWDFTLRDANGYIIGSVNRNFGGFAREIFTDTGVYALRMESAAQKAALESADGTELDRYEREATALTLDQRAVLLATAVSIDFDYFSRHSGVGHGGFMPVFWPMGGGAAAEGGAAGAGAGAGAAGAGAGAASAAEGAGALEGVSAAGGAASRGLGTGAGAAAESGIAGAGTMAGYEAMQRGVYGSRSQADDASPQSSDPAMSNDPSAQNIEQAENRPGNDDVWGEDQDPWGGNPPSAGGNGEGGGGWLDKLSDFFGGD